MASNMNWKSFVFRWFIPSLIAFSILFLPDLVNEKSANPIATNWFARIFFAFYLIVPFLNMAKLFDHKKELKDRQFYVIDKDSLVLGTWIAEIVSFIMVTIVAFLATDILFVDMYPLIYVFIVLYIILVSLTLVYRLKYKLSQIY